MSSLFLQFLVQIVSIKSLFDNQNAISICSFYSRLVFCKLYLLKWVKCAKNTFVSMSQTLFLEKNQMMSKIFRFLPFSRRTARAYRANVVQHFSSAFLRLIVKNSQSSTCLVSPSLLSDPRGSRGRYLTIVSKTSCSLECKIDNASLTAKLVFPKSSMMSGRFKMSRHLKREIWLLIVFVLCRYHFNWS